MKNILKEIGLLLMIIVLLTGCGKINKLQPNDFENSDNNSKHISAGSKNVENADDYSLGALAKEELINEEAIVVPIENDERQEVENDKEQSIKQEEKPKIEQVKKSIENPKKSEAKYSKVSWFIVKNQNNTTPQIKSGIKPLLEKYDAYYVGDVTSNKIYLTFDEGYENGYTPLILDTLKDRQVKATFFITGSYLKRNKDLVRRMINEGHELGNHTVNHPSLPELEEDQIKKELDDLNSEYYNNYGSYLRYLRPPMGEYSERMLDVAKKLGYKTIFWSFAYSDYDVNKQKGAQNAIDNVIPNLHNGAIILLHAVSKDNAEALDEIITKSQQKGYEFGLLSDMF